MSPGNTVARMLAIAFYSFGKGVRSVMRGGGGGVLKL